MRRVTARKVQLITLSTGRAKKSEQQDPLPITLNGRTGSGSGRVLRQPKLAGLYLFLRPTCLSRVLGDGLSLTGGECVSTSLPTFKTTLSTYPCKIVSY
jgi:hypothetical protein